VHRKLKEVLRHSYELQHNERLEVDSEKYNNFKKQVLVAERLILQTIAFDLTVEHPYRFLQEHVALIKCSPEERKDLMQTAWSFVNDSFASAVCLQFRPQLIAAAAIYLAAKNKKIELKSVGDKEWWQAANINLDDLENSTSQILESFPRDPSKDENASAGAQPSGSGL
jgi:cyclin T